jgi:putative DNA primase/helicase
MQNNNIQLDSPIDFDDIKGQSVKNALINMGVDDHYDGLLKSETTVNVSGVTLTSEPISHDKILKLLLEKVVRIDFRARAGIGEKEKLRNSHYQIIVIEEILDLAKHNQWNICQCHDFIYLYNGAYWSLLDKEELMTFIGDAAEKMSVDKFKARHYQFREQLYKQFLTSANLSALGHQGNMVLVNLQNGTYEISTEGVRLKDFNMHDFLTYQLPFEYNDLVKAPRFQAYLDRVLPDKKSQMILAEYLGYVFIQHGYLKLEKTLLLYGSGANGKSVLFEVVNALLGTTNISSYSLQSLTNENGYFRAQIANKLVNYASEINGKLETSIFKQLVSGEPVEARLPYGDPFLITKYAKLIFNCNELPRDVEHTHAYFRRFLIVPFEVTIPESEQDKELALKIIKNELSGVFNWVIGGLKRLLEQKGFTYCEAVQNALKQYEKESDSVKQFLEEQGYVKDSHDYIPLKELYNEFRGFCYDDGFKPLNKTNFRKRLHAMEFNQERRNLGNIVFLTKTRIA